MRSSWKIPFFRAIPDTQKSLAIPKNQKIYFFYLNCIVLVHDGKKDVEITINSDMLGQIIGEFVTTKIIPFHPALKKKNIKKKDKNQKDKNQKDKNQKIKIKKK